MANPNTQETACLVIEYDIVKAKEGMFCQWQEAMQKEVAKFEGYVRTDIFPPVKGVQKNWHIAVHFDSPANLTNWLDSENRHLLIRYGRSKFGGYRYTSLGTGLESWFSRNLKPDASTSPPPWKQNFAVLLGLYPTVMVETLLFSHFGLMETWTLAPKMFINNLVSCSLLTWVVMPLVTRLLSFWLRPKNATLKINAIGGLLLLISYTLMISIFQTLPQ
ncbi:MAG TPA: hypothetical protein IGS53_16210 [Leptolyngbyaceae cyanobacterium M33_DOE_097]|uniref:Antibiotic biosynthesis monooxygenase n=1 Tax=Oscillatoriales cyanobacterium SpSt-418 TaxID=2282169 RepID=A0A7C3KHP0_9CYAN|nr:hypothetical protein [Leptolyngbyaceae cyanobacterium M33_DOE_097]